MQTDKEVPIDLVAPSLAPVSGDRLIEVAKPEALDDDDASSLSWLPFILYLPCGTFSFLLPSTLKAKRSYPY